MWLLYAFLCAVSFGLRGILYQWTSQKPIDRNLLLLGVYATGALVSAFLWLLAQHHWTSANLVGIVMGTLSFVSNGAMYRAFAVGKASIVAILTALTPVVVVTVAYFMFGETLHLWQLISFVVILTGIIMIRYSGDLSLKNLKGAQWGILAMTTFGLTDIAGKQAMVLNAAVYPTLVTMFTTGSVLFALFWLKGRRKAIFASSTQLWSVPKTLLTSMIVGSTNICGMIAILSAFRLGITGLVSAVAALSVLIIILYAAVFLKEKLTRLEVAGIAIAFVGIILLRLLG